MNPMLTGITITDFRSLKGTVTIPLDAPVVLLHGPNGAGKTSVLSAIELALTGDVSAMRRSDASYQSHLVHYGAGSSRISLTASGQLPLARQSADLSIGDDSIAGAPLLEADFSSFFSERCYLAQSTLGRLLEIYQAAAKPREDSPLTRFVKDLLGLDQLDALIEGLQPVGDIRNFRRLIPDYGDAEKERDKAQSRIKQNNAHLAAIGEQIAALRTSISEALVALDSRVSSELPIAATQLEVVLQQDNEEPQAVTIVGQRRTLLSLRDRAQAAQASPDAAQLTLAENQERDATSAREQWMTVTGAQLESAISTLRDAFPDLPSAASTDPSIALQSAMSRVDAEITRCSTAITQDDAVAQQLEQANDAVAKSRARIAIVDEQISKLAGDAQSLSHALAALIPHIRGDNCPVCSRDFSEASKVPLTQHVAGHVARLTEQANTLQNLAKTRLEAGNDLARGERARDSLAARRLSPEMRNHNKARIASLTSSRTQLERLRPNVMQGANIIRNEAEARRRLSELRLRDRLSVETRSATNELCTRLGIPPPAETESTIDALNRGQLSIDARSQTLADRSSRRRRALEETRSLISLEKKSADLRREIEADTQTLRRSELAISAADTKRQYAKDISSAAADARSSIVGRVFNSSLNKIWRDLFVRLAPTEPYVPMFRLPQSAKEQVTAQLETVHREGGTGGTPGSMLSAGNLNTAALTLFLALHLAVKPKLPWLILDDPVQSMDEVHISQFAALLRTLSKEHGRQIVIAVHERPLFDYLALELSPAFENDRLIAVELSRTVGGASFAEPTYSVWKPDRAFAA